MAYMPSGPDEERFLKEYDPTKYRNPRWLRIPRFCCRRRRPVRPAHQTRKLPVQGRWALPGGFVEIEEDILTVLRAS